MKELDISMVEENYPVMVDKQEQWIKPIN